MTTMTPLSILADQRGITLAEILVALSIIFAGMFALASVIPMATGQVGEAHLETAATFLAQQRLEQIKNSRWSTAADLMCGGNAACDDGAGVVAPQWPDEAYETIAINGTNYPRFRRTVRIATCSIVACGGLAADPTLATLREVTISVFFLPLTGTGQYGANEKNITVTTLIAQRQ